MKPKYNIPDSIKAKIDKNLHRLKWHPLCTIKNKIYKAFPGYEKFDTLSPKVKIIDNFDKLLIPKDHPSRSLSDTFYFNDEYVLRTHTTAHQADLLKGGHTQFLICGDVYRKDEIDKFHYPVFHQIDGVCIVDDDVDPMEALQNVMSNVIDELFPGSEWKFQDDYFPFTEPSVEVVINHNGDEIEVLGAGAIRKEILEACGMGDKKGFAFGVGLERLAMVLFDIPDIRYFWSQDSRFIQQFSDTGVNKFRPFSKYPPVTRDISFYAQEKISENDFAQVCRDVAGDLIEQVSLTDEFFNEKKQLTSYCYRIIYRSFEKNLNSDEANELHSQITNSLGSQYKIEIR